MLKVKFFVVGGHLLRIDATLDQHLMIRHSLGAVLRDRLNVSAKVQTNTAWCFGPEDWLIQRSPAKEADCYASQRAI